MTTESLQQIIAVENELHAREQAEQVRAEQWRKEQEASIRAEVKRQHASLAEQLACAREKAREQAEREAASVLNAARKRAGRIAAVSDDSLRQAISRHLETLIAGRIP